MKLQSLVVGGVVGGVIGSVDAGELPSLSSVKPSGSMTCVEGDREDDPVCVFWWECLGDRMYSSVA